MFNVEEQLRIRGYNKCRAKKWSKNSWVVNIVQSSEDRLDYYRIKWREEWKNNRAIIYDYSQTKGPICIIPPKALFNSDFVKEKRKELSYTNSKLWWTQRFPIDHELTQLVLNYQDNWKLL